MCQFTWITGISRANTREVQVFHILIHMRYRYFPCQYMRGTGISHANTRELQEFHMPIHVRSRYFTCQYAWITGISHVNTRELQVFHMPIQVNYRYFIIGKRPHFLQHFFGTLPLTFCFDPPTTTQTGKQFVSVKDDQNEVWLLLYWLGLSVTLLSFYI